ncbi:hypothetical protein kac65v162_gp076 [Nodularia phage vB_NspS-kac65v162]|uniref:Uncharacterized protein n=3 Tax=Ravarandavirus kac65v151 TaxID=2845689 RepID=A0A482MHN1_9CAUD|nr:hypothetical protein HWC12_gp076 [Nodularia phage vB_NspS-kac65v151]QBQ73106.1 hypothetical protein kac65v151_gp076 [Nodularia phage vB_NspS-kac65v151]QBQ73314.1 hypothetical protein kac65v161_gp076 [Nodularia phage vB_NspS-kac65v161]QBQ73520.1 hypothetical protein kac65v162_gp076 [Nodularia phage vB_NspS-kac65v162]
MLLWCYECWWYIRFALILSVYFCHLFYLLYQTREPFVE